MIQWVILITHFFLDLLGNSIWTNFQFETAFYKQKNTFSVYSNRRRLINYFYDYRS
jgi:hypothetical protein